MRRRIDSWRITFILLGLSLILTGCSTFSGIPFLNSDITPGTKVEELNLGGMKHAEALAQLATWQKQALEREVVLRYDQQDISVPLKDLGADLDIDEIMQNVKEHPGSVIAANVHLDPAQAESVLAEKLTSLSHPAVDAGYQITHNTFQVIEATPGKEPDIAGIVAQIDTQPLGQIPQLIENLWMDSAPEISTEEMQALAFDSVIGEYCTYYNVTEINRSSNLKAAAASLDQKVLMPHEVCSFNQTVGPRTPETGYKDAYIIVNNEFVLGTGGGICQVSSTLYNAALLANLDIEQRAQHALAVAYVPLGRDATVNYPNLDLQFRNNTASVIYIRTYAEGGEMRVRLYGRKSDVSVQVDNYTRSVIPFETIHRDDPDLFIGESEQIQSGANGYQVETYKTVVDAQGNSTQTFLSKDTYAPTNRIVLVGTRAATPEPESSTVPVVTPSESSTTPIDDSGAQSGASSTTPVDSPTPPATPGTDERDEE
ncbi:MAG: VanW family protein [Peptococcaceae bacterium]|nr:VanW family protein [Peptococcaceae bacterium]